MKSKDPPGHFVSEGLFNTFFEQDAMGMALRAIDPRKSLWLRVNQKFCDMLGYTRDELLQLTSVDISLPDEKDIAIEYNDQLFRGDLRSYNREKRYLRKDGSIIWTNIWLSAVYGDDGVPAQIISVIQDITERKKIEAKLYKSERYLRAFFRNSDTTINIKDTDGRFVLVSRKFEQIFGLSEEQAHGKFPDDIYPKAFAEHVRKHDLSILQKGILVQQEDVVPGSDPPTVLLASKFPITGDSGEVMGIGTISMDITDRKRIEDELLTQSEIVTHMVEGAFLVRINDSTIVYTNPSLDKMFGYEAGEMPGMHHSKLNAPTDMYPEDMASSITREIKLHGVWRGEVCSIKKNGTIFWRSSNISRFNHPVYGEVLVSVNFDSTARRQADEKLSFQATHDALTGLITRTEFERRAERLMSTIREDKREHALCFMDLDQFKVVNDTCGHTAGDELLRQLGQVLQSTVRHRDTLARLGGDEFGVLMEHCSLDQAQRAAEALLKQVDNFQFIWEGQIFRIGVSIGLVAITETTANLTELLKQADAACYRAKDLGRNCIHVYLPDDAEMAQRHGETQWVARINQALDENRFCLYAQIIVPLDKGADLHYELLLRMVGEHGEIIPPGAFLPAAERYNLIDQLDRWVIKNAFGLLASHPAFVEQINFISINLSGQSLTNVQFLDTVVSLIDEFKINTGKICFEITETAAISNLNAATMFISRLKDLGCRFALDDFGSGLSSFAYLKNFSVDYLKIDGMFVKDMVGDTIDYAMVKSINEIGHIVGMKTIAEFVENDAIKELLVEIGVDYAQGYGIGKPKPFSEILKLVI